MDDVNPATYIRLVLYCQSVYFDSFYKTFFSWKVYSGDAIKEIDSVEHKTMRVNRSNVRLAA